MRNVECGMAREGRSRSDAPLYIPHSALRIPHLCGKALLHHAANHMLDGEMNFLDPRRVVRGNDQHDVAQVFEPTAQMPHEAHDRHAAGLRGLCGADHIGAFPLVEWRDTTSPARARASTWRANTSSNPMSLAHAVSRELSVVSATARRAGRVD